MSNTPILDPDAAYALWAARYPPYAHNPLMKAEERAMLSLLPAHLADCNVLDTGCGSGRYLHHAWGRGARRLIGIDLSWEMVQRARMECHAAGLPHTPLIQASLTALPMTNSWADVTICGLTIGHLEELRAPLVELSRVTRPGGMVICSDFHPVGAELGWRREFRIGDQRYAVRHTVHNLHTWQTVCRELGLRIVALREPFLEAADIPPNAVFDSVALQVPVALVFALMREA